MLQFVWQIATNPAVVGGTAYIGGKVLDATAGDAVKAVVAKLKSSGKAHVANILNALKKRFPDREPQIIVKTMAGVFYPLPVENPDEAFAQIAADVDRVTLNPDRLRFYDLGQWMTPDELDEVRKNKPK